MTLHTFQTEFWLPEKRERVFAFFGDAFNLQRITPPWLRFHVLTPQPILMQPGAMIAYRLRLHGVPLRWLTEITHWEPPVRFVDEQRRGPYRFWVHTHTFREQGGGTLCRDQVDYAVPGGAWVDRLIVRPQLRSIFGYRERALKIRFPQPSAVAVASAGPNRPPGPAANFPTL